MFDITIGESDRRRGWHDVAKHVECCGNYSTSAEAQVSWLTSSAVCAAPHWYSTFLRRGGNASLLWVLRQCSLARSSKT
jgi:hypothetical protein